MKTLDDEIKDFKIPDNLDLPDIDFDLPELPELPDLNFEIPDFDLPLPAGGKDLPEFSDAVEKGISLIKSNTKSPKRKRGRPTIITEEWCRETAKVLPGMFENGASISEVVCNLGISRRSFLNACQKSNELMRAKKDGLIKAEAWWEGIGHKAVMGGIPGFNATVWIFNMKNRFGWRDKHDVKPDSEIKIYIDAEDVGC